jgi:L-alanine-DL-glutamate epimerase-like enolase superfamily enzyme
MVSARALLEQGYRQVKVKGGANFEQDLETVAAIRAACGGSLQIRLDINTGYQNPAVALPLCRRLEAAGVDLFEQPLRPDDLEGMAFLRQHLATPIVAHESVAGLREAYRIIDMKAADILNVSLPRMGGFYPTSQLITYAEQRNVPVMIAGAMEAGAGNMAGAMIGAFCRAQDYPGDCITASLLSHTLVHEELMVDKGFFHIPNAPGLGLSLDLDAVLPLQQTPWQRIGF